MSPIITTPFKRKKPKMKTYGRKPSAPKVRFNSKKSPAALLERKINVVFKTINKRNYLQIDCEKAMGQRIEVSKHVANVSRYDIIAEKDSFGHAQVMVSKSLGLSNYGSITFKKIRWE